ncbi:MAG TPA: hypothetical protein VHO91_06150 [Rhodopila sp.]|nr:hypothetical protein [Rhodopila sp.]
MPIRFWFTLALLLSAVPGFGADLPSGEYVNNADQSATLDITRTAAGKTHFEMVVVGFNTNICSMSGSIAGLLGLPMEGSNGPADQSCKLHFTRAGQGLSIDYEGDGCMAYCGLGVSLPTDWAAVPEACYHAPYQATRQAFLKAYKAGHYAEAKALLAPLLHTCQPTLDTLDADALANDLAITLHHLGDDAGCRAMLQPMAKDAARTEAAVASDYPSARWDAYRPILHNARTNLGLCESGGVK